MGSFEAILTTNFGDGPEFVTYGCGARGYNNTGNEDDGGVAKREEGPDRNLCHKLLRSDQ